MDIDTIMRQVRDLMEFKERAAPMLAEWEAYKAKERIGAERPEPTAADLTMSAARIHVHAENIARIVAKK
jgi:hypothetical protein